MSACGCTAGRVGTDYCTCPLGRDLESVEQGYRTRHNRGISESNAGDIMESLAALKNFPPVYERAARVAIQELIEKYCESAEIGTKVRDALFERYDEWCGPASLIATIKEFTPKPQLEPSNVHPISNSS